jgi:hypothetical protein
LEAVVSDAKGRLVRLEQAAGVAEYREIVARARAFPGGSWAYYASLGLPELEREAAILARVEGEPPRNEVVALADAIEEALNRLGPLPERERWAKVGSLLAEVAHE